METKLSEVLEYLKFWHNVSDDDCIEMAESAEQALTNMMERDLCTDINNSLVEELNGYINK